MKTRETKRRLVPELVRRPAREVTLQPVFRYSEGPAHRRVWVWMTGAALLVAVVATFLVPQLT
jgi:hypothetical protein